MLVNTDHRSQIIYFCLSGLIAIAILILTYISVRVTINENFKEDLKIIQRSLIFTKPSGSWNYSNTWRPIGHAALRHQVYSAYFDIRTDVIDSKSPQADEIPIGALRIFAILPNNFSETITCIVRYEDYTLRELATEGTYGLHEDHGELFAAQLITCPIYNKRGDSVARLPQSVALTYGSNRLSRVSPTFITISYPRAMEQLFEKSRPSISLCVGPLQSNYSNVLRIVEFIELYRILGAQHFYFYHFNATDEVRRTLQHYVQAGVVDILEWNMQEHADDIHYVGIAAQYNECIYRAMVVDNQRYAAIVDLDEIIVPLKHNSLADYLRQCDEGRTSAFVFRNVFFYAKDSNDTFSVPQHTRNRLLYTQTKVRRTVEIMPYYIRSKCIVNTRAIIEMGNHQTWRVMPGYTDNLVHPSVALLFHYRDKCINCRALMNVDYTARRFGSLLWDRVDEHCLKVFIEHNGVCPMV